MTDRYATFLTCDDVLFGLNGKVFINGVYPADIVLPMSEVTLNQLVFYVMADTPIERPFKAFVIHVKLPGDDEPKIFDAMPFIRGMAPSAAPSSRTILRLRVPFLVQQLILRSGAIEVSVVHDEGVTFAGRQWVQAPTVVDPAASKH